MPVFDHCVVRLELLERKVPPLMGRLEESTEAVGEEIVDKESLFQGKFVTKFLQNQILWKF